MKQFIYRCPNCGNTVHFYEKGLASVKKKVRYSQSEKEISCDEEEVEVGEIISPQVTCAMCGVRCD